MWSSAICGSSTGQAGHVGVKTLAGDKSAAALSDRKAFDLGEVLRLPARTTDPSIRRTNSTSAVAWAWCSHGSSIGESRCVPMTVSAPGSLAQTKAGMPGAIRPEPAAAKALRERSASGQGGC
jgi:hypothetical protein